VKRVLLAALILAACATPPPPAPEAAPQPVAPGQETAIGTVRVTANALNVRREASASADVIAQVKKGERLVLLSAGDDWDRVRLATGESGYVSVLHVMREGTRARRGCPADAEYQFVKTPMPAFSDSGAHGVVTVDASVDARGNVTSTKLIANTTGDEALGVLAEREIREAKFSPPIRNCVPKAFIFTYKRSF
jgi:TonB family protein